MLFHTQGIDFGLHGVKREAADLARHCGPSLAAPRAGQRDLRVGDRLTAGVNYVSGNSTGNGHLGCQKPAAEECKQQGAEFRGHGSHLTKLNYSKRWKGPTLAH